jgi:predicted DNA-binding transcriptional regulator AlpA
VLLADLVNDVSDETTSPPAPRLLKVPQLAAMMGVSEKAVWHRHYRGQIPGAVRIGASLFFRRDEVLRFLSEGRGLSPNRSR